MKLLKASVAMCSVKEQPLSRRHLQSTVLKHSGIGVLEKVSWESQLVCGITKGRKC